MMRLAILMLATIAGLLAILSVYGSGNLRAMREPPERPVQSAAKDAGGLFSTPEPAPDPLAPSPDIPDAAPTEPAPIPEAAPPVSPFPGPPLRPSPEYAGRTPTSAQAAARVPLGDGGDVMVVTGNRVNFRSGPSTGDGVVGALSQDTRVQILGESAGGWVNIRDEQGRTGYMSAKFLSPASDR